MRKGLISYDENVIEEINNKLSKTKEYYIKGGEKDNNIFSLPIQLVYLTLPYKATEEISWSKSVNDFTLSISSGINDQTKQHYGIPFGTMARKLIYYTCTQAAKKQTQTINLGSSYTQAFKMLGISQTRAGGQIINRFKDQILKLFFSRISMYGEKNSNKSEYSVKQALNLARGMEFFTNEEKFNFRITLTNDFYEYILNSKLVPFDHDIISKFDGSPMLMDLYIFLNYKAFSANFSKNDIFVSYEELHQAFGTLSSFKHFRQNIKKNISKLTEYHQGLILGESVQDNQTGIMISKHSQSNVTSKDLEQLDWLSSVEEK